MNGPTVSPVNSGQIADAVYRAQMLVVSLLGLILVLTGLVLVGYLLIIWWRHHNREENSLKFVTLQVKVPRDNEVKIDVAEQMFASLANLRKGGLLSFFKPQNHVALEIVGTKEKIAFYVNVPRDLKDVVEKQIFGAYPGAEAVEVQDYNIFSEEGKVAYAELQLKGSAYMPIKVYKDLATDPLSSLTSALAKMGDKEGAVIQIILVPAGKRWSKQGKKYLAKIKKREADPEKASYDNDPKSMEAVGNKVTKPGFEVSIRLVVSSDSQESAQLHLSNLKTAFAQFSSDLNGFTSKRVWLKHAFMIDFIYRYAPVWRNNTVLNAEEVATIYHFPNKSVETPHIQWINAKRAPAPEKISTSGMFIGVSKYRGVDRPVYISEKDRQRHMYIIGKTGTGKSEFMKEMIMQDIRAGKGVCFIDPHDTVEQILELIPPERAEDVIYFDPSDTERPMGLNIMEAHNEDQKHMVVSSIIGLMYKLYDPHQTGIIGPRFEHAIRNAMLTVMYEPGSTFVEVVRILSDPRYVQEVLPKVSDPIIRRYWTDQIAQTSDFHKSEVLDYIVSKFGRFVTNTMMRNIIGQSKSAFDFRRVMDEGKILLINLAKGKIGEENSSFLGLILVPKILIAAMSRADVSEAERPDFYLYVDEFQNFATKDFAVILSEARKYHLNLTVANQFVGQVGEEVKDAVFGNVGTLVTFRVGVQDANFLQHEFSPTFSEADLTNIERFNVFVKTIVNNEPVPPFSMSLVKDMAVQEKMKNPKVAEIIKQLSRLKYGKDRDIVEAEMARRARL